MSLYSLNMRLAEHVIKIQNGLPEKDRAEQLAFTKSLAHALFHMRFHVCTEGATHGAER